MVEELCNPTCKLISTLKSQFSQAQGKRILFFNILKSCQILGSLGQEYPNFLDIL